MQALARIAAVVGLLLLGAVALLFLAQRRLLYFPSVQPLPAATAAARARGLEPWLDGAARARGLEPWLDGAGRFLGWRAPAPGEPSARVLVLHGNAGSALDRTYLRDVVQGPGRRSVEVLLLEYPGYGPRPGAPTEESVVAAAVEAIDLLGHVPPLFLAGESLGSAAAARAAALRPRVAGLLLLTPLASVTAVARRHYPFIPSLLVRDAFRADAALPAYGGRVAFLLAGQDEVVFTDLGRALHQAYPGPKRLWEEPGASHNTLRYDPADPRWTEVWTFLAGPG